MRGIRLGKENGDSGGDSFGGGMAYQWILMLKGAEGGEEAGSAHAIDRRMVRSES